MLEKNAVVHTEDGSCTLNSDRYGETYHSTFGALTEARHVFLDATGVSDRLKRGALTNILEIGFGLGLNALLSADLAKQFGTCLHFHSFEHDLVTPARIRSLGYSALMADKSVHAALIAGVEDAFEQSSKTSPIARTCQYELAKDIHLHLHLEDASTADFRQFNGKRFHAIYLDAFSPDTNAECWEFSFIDSLARLLTDDGAMSTYSAKGDVRRAMLAAGLKARKRPGPPGKREMLVGFR